VAFGIKKPDAHIPLAHGDFELHPAAAAFSHPNDGLDNGGGNPKGGDRAYQNLLFEIVIGFSIKLLQGASAAGMKMRASRGMCG